MSHELQKASTSDHHRPLNTDATMSSGKTAFTCKVHKYIYDVKKKKYPLDFRGSLHCLAVLRVSWSAWANSAHSAHKHDSWISFPGGTSRKARQ